MAKIEIVPPRIPITDPDTGLVGREWFRFLTAQLGQVNSTITGAALTEANDTNVTLTLAGSPASALLAPTSITAGWQGQLSIARGGTGAANQAGAQTALGVPSTAGVGASGTWGINITGSASSATTATTATSAAKWTTARALAGNSVDGSAAVPFANTFIVQGTADAGLTGAQFMGALGTGIVKNTTTTGVQSIAIAADFPTLNQNTSGTSAGLSGAPDVTVGNVTLSTVGKKLSVKEGANASMGVATLVLGTVVVANTLVTANSRIFLTVDAPGIAVGAVYVSARTAGTSFTITSVNATDTSDVSWFIVEPA